MLLWWKGRLIRWHWYVIQLRIACSVISNFSSILVFSLLPEVGGNLVPVTLFLQLAGKIDHDRLNPHASKVCMACRSCNPCVCQFYPSACWWYQTWIAPLVTRDHCYIFIHFRLITLVCISFLLLLHTILYIYIYILYIYILYIYIIYYTHIYIYYQRKLGSNTSVLRTNRILRLEMMKGGRSYINT